MVENNSQRKSIQGIFKAKVEKTSFKEQKICRINIRVEVKKRELVKIKEIKLARRSKEGLSEII